jgi:pimeloyl-ACP methyl ester carboxylesterase
MRVLRGIGAVVGLLVVIGVVVLAADYIGDRRRSDELQEALEPFYTPPDPLPSTEPGHLIRYEPLGESIEGAETYRILYVTERPDGTPTVSSGMLLVPTAPAPPGGRKVVAWAHPTVGLGDRCAPSRRDNPIRSQMTEPWMLQMVKFGWVVVATDYAGLGTPGQSLYLIGRSEAYDVINSVRAARAFPGADAGSAWAVYGHSQGGHSALWTGVLAREYAPELDLVAVTAAAPAAELVPLVDAQWDQEVAWVIGPKVVESWPEVYPDLPLEGLVHERNLERNAGLARECVVEAAIEGIVRQKLGRRYFAANPAADDAWRAALADQTPPPVTEVPVLVVQGTHDGVVIPNTTALLVEQWCDAGSELTMVWLGGLWHMGAGERGGTIVGDYLWRVFNGRDAGNTCDLPATIDPYPAPVPSGE